jgi:hypothetical protein
VAWPRVGWAWEISAAGDPHAQWQAQVTANYFQLAILGRLDLDSPVARPLIAHTREGGETD